MLVSPSPQLYDLMTMAFKYQVLLCPRPKDILLVSFNHMDAIKDFVKDTPSILSQVDETFQQLIEVMTCVTLWTRVVSNITRGLLGFPAVSCTI